jgi:hypothetical protein
MLVGSGGPRSGLAIPGPWEYGEDGGAMRYTSALGLLAVACLLGFLCKISYLVIYIVMSKLLESLVD